MKLMDKIKDLFMDEIVDDDEIELEEEEKEEYKEPPKEKILPKVMRETIEKEEKVELRVKPEEFKREEKKNEQPKENEQMKKFNFPVDFDLEIAKEESIPSRNGKNNYNDFGFNSNLPVDKTRENVKEKKVYSGNVNVLNLERETPKKVSELYPNKNTEFKPKFKASPVISPVYGVLDKNYTKEEVREKTDDNSVLKRPSKKVDFETVRKKAFGNLADEIKDNMLCENCELYKEVKKISALKEDDLLYDMTVDPDDNKEVTIEKAFDNYEEFGVAYEPERKKKPTIELDEEKEDVTDTPSIINNANTEVDNNKEFVHMNSKVDVGEIKEDEESEITLNGNVNKELENIIDEVKNKPNDEFPTREEKKKETKVDDDFFKLIDSMYKERIDD